MLSDNWGIYVLFTWILQLEMASKLYLICFLLYLQMQHLWRYFWLLMVLAAVTVPAHPLFSRAARPYGLVTRAREGHCTQDVKQYTNCYLCGKLAGDVLIFKACCKRQDSVLRFCSDMLAWMEPPRTKTNQTTRTQLLLAARDHDVIAIQDGGSATCVRWGAYPNRARMKGKPEGERRASVWERVPPELSCASVLWYREDLISSWARNIHFFSDSFLLNHS